MATLGLNGKPGIRSLVVFGDSLCDAGNSALWAEHYSEFINPDQVPEPALIPTFPWPYFGHRASNGPVWVEVIGQAYGYEVIPSLQGGADFAFSGAESGPGLSDQFTPNFHFQIQLYRQAVEAGHLPPPTPWQLFVVWFGVNDIQRSLASQSGPIDPAAFIQELVSTGIGNIAQGIAGLQGMKARMFLVPNLPPMHLTPYGHSLPVEVRQLLAALTVQFNLALNSALDDLEAAYPKLTIFRLDVATEYTNMVALPAKYGFRNVTEPAFYLTETGIVWNWDPADMASFDPNFFLSWDGFHPTAAAHAILAGTAMEIIPIGTWWMPAGIRGPAPSTASNR